MSRRGSAQLLLLFFHSRKRRAWSMAAIAVSLIVAGLLQVAGAFPIMTRTGLGQLLRQSAWQHALAGLSEQPAWPWTETSTEPSSSVPRLGLSASVATGADIKDGSVVAPVERVSAGDPHLAPKAFGEISIGDSITVTRADDSAPVSRVTGCRVVDPHLAESAPEADDRNSAVDCSQLDRALADSLGLVIQATRAEPPAPPAPRPQQKL
jgi:hypothetical protein